MTQVLVGPMTSTRKINTKDSKISYNDAGFSRTNVKYTKDKYKGQQDIIQ